MRAELDGAARVKVVGSIKVFVALLCLTLLTVAASYLHLPHKLALATAIGIALVKAGLVAAVFMHLKSEQRVVYAVLGFTALFFFLLLFLPHWTSPGGLVARY
jgi:caa(3)-type oxidase subunit IV